ncbi:MAG: chromosome segregation protein SMC, partial [Verrucomicrobiota bacterium]
MNVQPELLPQDRDFHPDFSSKEPLVWVRELALFRTFASGESNVVRRIRLRPGLNILWAHPMKHGAEPLPEPVLDFTGVSGHASGKTTFCRFLRHILGEPNFGSDDQRTRLR